MKSCLSIEQISFHAAVGTSRRPYCPLYLCHMTINLHNTYLTIAGFFMDVFVHLFIYFSDFTFNRHRAFLKDFQQELYYIETLLCSVAHPRKSLIGWFSQKVSASVLWWKLSTYLIV